ncbi:MAG: hypothetical protein VB021_07875 [Oscillospiraceae bacterium]|nr:hypothetical protein [Oscillospiraceae bacterium]
MKNRISLLQAQTALAAAAAVLALAARLLAPGAFGAAKEQYGKSMEKTPVWSLGEIRQIVQPAKDALLRLWGD